MRAFTNLAQKTQTGIQAPLTRATFPKGSGRTLRGPRCRPSARFKTRGPNSPASHSSLKLIVKTTHSTCTLMASRAGSQSSHGQDLATLIEAEAEKAFDLLRGRECAPLPMGKAGSQEVEAREGDDAAVVEGDGRPAGALEWRSLPFRPTMWQVISAQASGPPARVRAPS